MLERPVTIGDLFGWLSPGINRRGVLLCGTHGYEQHNAHRSWRGLAKRIAATGCTTLRFDYPGEGDSGDFGAGELEAWIGSIRRATNYLRIELGAEEIVLVGLRLGGTLAALSAQEETVDRLILLAPFVTGRAYLREMKLQARACNLLPNGNPMPEDSGTLNVGGFYLNATLISDLSAISLDFGKRFFAPRILLMGADNGGLAAKFAALGSDVTTAPFTDLKQLVASALNSTLTEATASLVAEFAASGALQRLMPPPSLFPAGCITGTTWREKSVQFGPNMFGIFCGPADIKPLAATILFLNMGMNVHSGYGRQTTTLARSLTDMGVSSLRMDLLGVGDSADRDDEDSPLYNLKALDDVRAAIDYLVGLEHGPVVVAGTCNGAYLAFHAICQDDRIRGAVLANLYCFDWNHTHHSVPFSENPVRSIGAYANLLRQSQAWRRVLSGRTPVVSITYGLLRRSGRKWLQKIAKVFVSTNRDLTVSDRIVKLRVRGAHLALIYSAGDLGLADLRAHLGKSSAKIAQLIGEPVRILEGADHAFGTTKSQMEILCVLRNIISKFPPKATNP